MAADETAGTGDDNSLLARTHRGPPDVGDLSVVAVSAVVAPNPRPSSPVCRIATSLLVPVAIPNGPDVPSCVQSVNARGPGSTGRDVAAPPRPSRPAVGARARLTRGRSPTARRWPGQPVDRDRDRFARGDADREADTHAPWLKSLESTAVCPFTLIISRRRGRVPVDRVELEVAGVGCVEGQLQLDLVGVVVGGGDAGALVGALQRPRVGRGCCPRVAAGLFDGQRRVRQGRRGRSRRSSPARS